MGNHSTKSKSKLLVKPRSKKLTPASIAAQKAWAGFSPKLKKELRRALPDTDGDGTPNGFDCRPRNRKKQESFLSEDAAYLDSNPSIELGRRLGEGTAGAVYSIKGNKNMVVKVPLGNRYSKSDAIKLSEWVQRKKLLVAMEANVYNRYNLENEPLCIPTKIMDLGTCDAEGNKDIWLIRPKVKIQSKMTKAQIEQVRRKVISLSHKGFMICDGLQVGVDRMGRVLLYDLGYLGKGSPATAFRSNSRAWKGFLVQICNLKWDDENGIEKAQQKYGMISPDEQY